MPKAKHKLYTRQQLDSIKNELINLDLYNGNSALKYLEEVIIDKLKLGVNPKKIYEFLKNKGITDITVLAIEEIKNKSCKENKEQI